MTGTLTYLRALYDSIGTSTTNTFGEARMAFVTSLDGALMGRTCRAAQASARRLSRPSGADPAIAHAPCVARREQRSRPRDVRVSLVGHRWRRLSGDLIEAADKVAAHDRATHPDWPSQLRMPTQSPTSDARVMTAASVALNLPSSTELTVAGMAADPEPPLEPEAPTDPAYERGAVDDDVDRVAKTDRGDRARDVECLRLGVEPSDGARESSRRDPDELA